MPRKLVKGNFFVDYTNKVYTTTHPTEQPQQFLPTNIHHFLAIFIKLSYYICVFPYRLEFKGETGQYEIRSNILQKVKFSLLRQLSTFLIIT